MYDKENHSHNHAQQKKTSSLYLFLLLCMVVLIGLQSAAAEDEENIFEIDAQIEALLNIEPIPTRQLPIRSDGPNGSYSITNQANTDFKILQITDIHICGSSTALESDMKAITAVTKLVTHTAPDLIIITGDLVYANPLTGSVDNQNAMYIVKELMIRLGIPWLFTYGNHDAEVFNTYNKQDLSRFLSSSDTCLHQTDLSDEITGVSNQTIQILNSDGSLNQTLVLLDSNSYIQETDHSGYDNIWDNQIFWYKTQLKTIEERYRQPVSSLMFFHIPFEEYKIAWDLYEANSSDVTWHYGTKREPICAPMYQSNLMETIIELGSTKGIFCGHDHLNDFSITYQGIRLTYGQSIDYIAYPDNSEDQRGATLITLHPDSSFDVSPIYLNQIP